MRVFTIPNIITFVRIILIPVFVTALVYKDYSRALLLFVAAGITDALDGLLARLTDQKSQLGAFLDPLADKFLLVTSLILFSLYGWIPTWLTITVMSRDIVVTVGWVVMYLMYHTIRIDPSLIGKVASASQVLLVAYVLLTVNFKGFPVPGDWVMWCVAAVTVSSGLHYVYRAIKHAE